MLGGHRGRDAVGVHGTAAAGGSCQEAVVDRRRDVAELGKGVGEIDDVAGGLVAAAEAASVDPEDDRPLGLGVADRFGRGPSSAPPGCRRVRGAPVLDVGGAPTPVEDLVAVANRALSGGPGETATGEDGDGDQQGDERHQPRGWRWPRGWTPTHPARLSQPCQCDQKSALGEQDLHLLPRGRLRPDQQLRRDGDVLRRRGDRVDSIIEESSRERSRRRGFEERLMRSQPPSGKEAEEDPASSGRNFIRDTSPVFRRPTIESWRA